MEQSNKQKELYEQRHAEDIQNGEMPLFKELSPEEQAAICERCGVIVDSEMPFEEGDMILCGGDGCYEDHVGGG